jgi:5'-nucleotidase (lipoprotein e(P4) family)
VQRRLEATLALAVLLVSCQSWMEAPPVESSLTHESLDAVLWAKTSAEYRASTEQAYRLAEVRLDEALRPENAAWTAEVGQVGDYTDLPPAVVLDVDEGVLETSTFQAGLVEKHRRFRLAEWNDWVQKEEGRAVPGAVEFAQYARARGVRIFYVTNREHAVEGATRRNLQKLGFPVDADGGNILSKNEREGWGSDKGSRREFVAASYRVVLIAGDDLNDFVSGSRLAPRERVALARRWGSNWGTKWIILPNPIYGGWERSLYEFNSRLTPAEILRRKHSYLEASE